MTDISHYLSLPYRKVLHRDDEGDVIAMIEELEGCVAHGGDEAEALKELHDAQVAWIEAALDDGQDIPVPELPEDLPSGKFVVRMPRSLHQKLNKLAKKDDISLNQLVVMAATEHVSRREAKDEIMEHARRTVHQWHPARPATWEVDAPKRMARKSRFMVALQRKEGPSAVTEKNDPHFVGRRSGKG